MIGGKWRVGDGRSIDIYSDHWLRESTFKLISPSRPSTDSSVKSLILDGFWNAVLVVKLLSLKTMLKQF